MSSKRGRRRPNHLPRRREDDTGLNERWEDDLPTHDARGRPYPPIRLTDSPADIVLPRLCQVRGYGETWSARCPAHPDLTPSLTATALDNGTLLIHCHAGCKAEEIM